MTGVLFACVAGVFFAALNITMRRALARVADIDAGSAVISTVAFAFVAATAVASGSDLDAGELWPFLLIGTLGPGLSQLLVVYRGRSPRARYSWSRAALRWRGSASSRRLPRLRGRAGGDLHFSRAAERLRLSQPALSKQIRQPERELRFPLFPREGRRVELTAAGEALLPAARQLLAGWEQALAVATHRANEEATLLQAGFQTSVGGGLYQDIAARFAKLRPEWRLELRAHVWSDPTGGLRDGSADVAFIWLPAGAEDVIEVLPLRSERKYVALPAEHRLARKGAIQLADLLQEPFVALPPEAGALRDHWLALEERGAHPVRIGAEARTADEAFEAVATGHGVTLLAEGNISVYARPGIVCRPVVGVQPCQLGIAWRRGDERKAVREVVDTAGEVAVEAEQQATLEVS